MALDHVYRHRIRLRVTERDPIRRRQLLWAGRARDGLTLERLGAPVGLQPLARHVERLARIQPHVRAGRAAIDGRRTGQTRSAGRIALAPTCTSAESTWTCDVTVAPPATHARPRPSRTW